MATLVLDASVLVALLDSADAHHEMAVADVERADLAGEWLVAPASAYSEALVAFARAGRLRDGREAIAGMGISVVALEADDAAQAAQLRARHDRLRLPDAMVLAAAQATDARRLTYDHGLQTVAAGTED